MQHGESSKNFVSIYFILFLILYNFENVRRLFCSWQKKLLVICTSHLIKRFKVLELCFHLVLWVSFCLMANF